MNVTCVNPSSVETRSVTLTRPFVVASLVKRRAFLAGHAAIPPLQPVMHGIEFQQANSDQNYYFAYANMHAAICWSIQSVKMTA